MSRVVLRLILDVVLTIAVALLLLGGWFSILGGGFTEGFRVLFNFMDVGLALWLVLQIIVIVLRSRQARSPVLSPARAYLLLLIGAVVNALVVLVVGFVQGGWAPLLVLFAIEAGLACLIAAAIVLPIVHRLVKPPEVTNLAT
ncbi:MAG: hypothetical protein AB7K08_11845, partial [Microbacteriaceae bacterium]